MESAELKRPVDIILQNRLHVKPEQIAAVCEYFNIAELGLFGSVLRDDFRTGGDNPSDVDILIELEPGHQLSWQIWLDLKAALEELFKRDVDVVRKHLLKNPYRRAEILKTNCIIYEQR